MKTDLDYFRYQDLIGTVVFRSTFNNGETININQAWSLAFSGGQEDKMLDFPWFLDFSEGRGNISLKFQIEWGQFWTISVLFLALIGISLSAITSSWS